MTGENSSFSTLRFDAHPLFLMFNYMKIKVNHICVFVFWAISRPFSERSQNKSFIISLLFVLFSVSNDAMRLPLRLNWIFLMFFNLIFVKICFHHSFMFLPTSLCRRQNGNWTLRFSLRFETFGFAYTNNEKGDVMSSESSQENLNCRGGWGVSFPVNISWQGFSAHFMLQLTWKCVIGVAGSLEPLRVVKF